MIRISPSTLAADFRKLGQEVVDFVDAGADWVHFDCMDGHFVENLTYGPIVIKALRELTDAPFDVHLMIANPDAQIEAYARAGADSIMFQAEVDPRPVRLLERIRGLGVRSGIVYNPATPLVELETILRAADLVMVMSVEPGAGGQEFMPGSLRKIELLRETIDRMGLDTLISVDGGINSHTAPLVINAGVDVIVTGSWFVKHPEGYRGAVEELRRLAGE